MKKKFVVGIIVILALTLVTLTGCGNKEDNIEKTGNSGTVQNNDNQQMDNKEGIIVTNVYATSDNYAVVVADKKTYIIDNNGKQQGTIDFEISEGANIKINNNGYIYYEASYENNKILDKTGKVILENNNDETYNYITENNYTLRTSKESSFENGESTKKEIIDLSGNVIKTIEEEKSYYYIGGDIWYCYGADEYLFNEKTGESVIFESTPTLSLYSKVLGNSNPRKIEYKSLSDGGTYLDSIYITKDFKIIEAQDMKYITNEYYYNTSDYAIYRYDETKVKEFTSGNGFENIYSTGDKYYVQSGTGYFYLLDENFNQIEEPYELGELKGNTKAIGNNRIINEESVKFEDKGYEGTWDHFYLYDYKGTLIEDLGEGWNGIEEVGTNIIKLKRMQSLPQYNERTGTRDTTYLGPQSIEKYINLYTGTVLKVY